MLQQKQIQFWTGHKIRAQVTRFGDKQFDANQYYLRLELYCDQAHELITTEIIMGAASECRDSWGNYQNKAWEHANQYNKKQQVRTIDQQNNSVHICTIG